ncbi:hypothetical protein BU26DRAFT_556598 [Trematosphaeria pertusa]|uniref:Uncharacterized protein n=1 Tax=Trematosphaeria pertusa TaxID=390896 RepID=A0A6A6HSR5_9PLEO|nr:uncharacterized protein BU26DRAFT_556598 [Trematosphaeria pertusa]KAF2240818.1 hypothetical protein BU26DRAFT_556598 [Trematosphaeria pertusa]
MPSLWRPINGPVESWPLALCDGRTVSPTSLIASERLRSTWSGGTTFVLHEEGNKWYFMSNQRNDEVAIFKNFDSKEDVAQYAAHSSFELRSCYPQARPRESIEVRAMVFTYPEHM